MLALKISFDHLWLMIYDQIFDMNEKNDVIVETSRLLRKICINDSNNKEKIAVKYETLRLSRILYTFFKVY